MKIYNPLYATQEVLDVLATLKLNESEKLAVLEIAKTIVTTSQEGYLLKKIEVSATKTESTDAPNQ